MKLGAFSISLTVKDLAASKAFYEKLGFETSGKVEEGTGPASLMLEAPDGNPILMDQHV